MFRQDPTRSGVQ